MIDRDFELVPPTVWLRLFYSATFLTMVSVATLRTLGLTFYLAIGQSPLWAMMFIAAPVVMWRLYLVWQYPTTLTRARAGGLFTILWGTAIATMAVGWLSTLAPFLLEAVRDLESAVRAGVHTPVFYSETLTLAASSVGNVGFWGLVIFEWTRLIGLEGVYRRTASMDVPENEPEPAVWLNVVALSALLMLAGTQIVELVADSVTQAGRSGSWFGVSDGRFYLGPLSYSFLGLVLALPTALFVVVRIVTLVRHRREIPLPQSTGTLRAVRKIALAGLVVHLMAVAARLIDEILGDASGQIGGAVPKFVSFLIMLLGPVSLMALEGSRLLAYERRERPELE